VFAQQELGQHNAILFLVFANFRSFSGAVVFSIKAVGDTSVSTAVIRKFQNRTSLARWFDIVLRTFFWIYSDFELNGEV